MARRPQPRTLKMDYKRMSLVDLYKDRNEELYINMEHFFSFIEIAAPMGDISKMSLVVKGRRG